MPRTGECPSPQPTNSPTGKSRAETKASAYADDMETSVGAEYEGENVITELRSVEEAKRELALREKVAVRRARHAGLSWAEIGTFLGVTRQTVHRKYRGVG